MNKFILIVLATIFTFGLGTAQGIDEEVEFKYIKAKYLLDTERYEDAIKAFTSIIKKDEAYSDALIQRAKAKYAMAAYKGTKKDVLQYAGIKGMNADALMLLGKSDYKMSNADAALNSLEIASKLNTEDAQIFEYLGNLYLEKDEDVKACKAFSIGASLGSSKARINSKKHCKGMVSDKVDVKVEKPRKGKMDPSSLPKKKNDDKKTEDESADPVEDERTPEQKRRDNDDSLNSLPKDKVLKNNKADKKDEVDEKDDEQSTDEDPTDEMGGSIDDEDDGSMPEEDNTPNTIEIDEDLTIVIRGQGLGKRGVLDQPNILILSDEDGIVAIDICVNKRGKVESAEFNTKLSTIAKKSLVSLAIRKSKDFWFEKNDFKEQCGVILFKIKGS